MNRWQSVDGDDISTESRQLGVAIIQNMANSIVSHLKLSKLALGGSDYNLFKDRPLWPLPPVSTAQKYVDGRLMTKFTEVRD